MEVVAGAVHPAETAKALLHSEATATKNYVQRGHHKAALVGHCPWVAGLRRLSSAETGNGKYQELKCTWKSQSSKEKTLAVFQPVKRRRRLQWRTQKGPP